MGCSSSSIALSDWRCCKKRKIFVGFFIVFFSRIRYRVERLQYYDMLESYPGVRMSQLYGPEHFLRLLVKLPELPDVVKKMRPEEILIFNSHLHSLVKYLVRRAGDLFSGVNYEVTKTRIFYVVLFDTTRTEPSSRISEAVRLSLMKVSYSMKL
jgi:hypothetical protein